MPPIDLTPLPGDDFTFGVSPPEFLDLADLTLGAYGTVADGWDQAFPVPVTGVQTMPDVLKAIKKCFQPVDDPWSNFLQPWEAPVGDAFAEASASGDAALSLFEGLFIAAPAVAPPSGPGTLPPAPGSGGGPPVTGGRSTPCPPGTVSELADPAFCLRIGAVGPITGPSAQPTRGVPGIPPAGAGGGT
jgi:hypothetical protein